MIDNIAASIQGLYTAIPPETVPLGTNSTTEYRPSTPNSGVALVGATVDKPKSFGDWLGAIASGVSSNALVQKYVDGKINKELLNDGVPVYVTTGNPNDQPGGQLLQDVASQRQAAQTKTWLIVGGGVFALVALYLIVRD